ncbi:MAG TPA: hypothetical protein VL242_02070 [Sorangium sp.]|uniref:hypothetical protein n=1 Tax=Sorangium sp. So ce1153 TaxID=3133333 RepID=UPI002BC366AD|nr:hypothetical protein [Sorangium sp.]
MLAGILHIRSNHAWGRVRRDEAERLLAQEQDHALRRDLLEEITGIFASDGALVTLFYAETHHGE